jgi:UDP-3-O-[3-hydroxymyristoyl] N-acetylglucosamine deacetylase
VTFQGIGLHSGREGIVTVHPSDAGGLWFRGGGQRFCAHACYVVDTRRCTTLGLGNARVSTVEHLLAALHAEEIDSAEIEVAGPEIPVLDGSSQPFVEGLRSVSRRATDVPRRTLVLRGPVTITDGNGSRIEGRPWRGPGAEGLGGGLRISARITLHHPMLEGQRAWSLLEPDRFLAQIAPSRTFGLIEEVAALLSGGHALGGSLDNALVVYPDHYSSQLRVAHEPARHKVLDMVGDLALAGARLVGSIYGRGTSHRLNVEFARRLVELAEGAPDRGDDRCSGPGGDGSGTLESVRRSSE